VDLPRSVGHDQSVEVRIEALIESVVLGVPLFCGCLVLVLLGVPLLRDPLLSLGGGWVVGTLVLAALVLGFAAFSAGWDLLPHAVALLLALLGAAVFLVRRRRGARMPPESSPSTPSGWHNFTRARWGSYTRRMSSPSRSPVSG
jgi:hypothetical protein